MAIRGLEDKRVLITGGAQGIGAATASRFLAEGARVVVLDKNASGLTDIRRSLPKLDAVLMADVSDADAVREAFVRLDGLWGGLDVLVNNAGISLRHAFQDITPDEWRRVIETNLSGTFLVSREAARRMTAASPPGGVILNMGSTNGIVGYHYYADYNASKAGVIELTRSLALELAPAVRVNCVCPGFILTPMQAAEYTPQMIASFEARVPLHRLGKPEDVAALFAFLASDDAAFITGQTFVIDGGEITGGLASQRV